jgi:hypothetical protein
MALRSVAAVIVEDGRPHGDGSSEGVKSTMDRIFLIFFEPAQWTLH